MTECLATEYSRLVQRQSEKRGHWSPTVDGFDVGTANMSDDHDRSRCLDGRSLMLYRSAMPDRVRADTDT